MKRLALGIGILFLSLLLAACGASPSPTPVPPTRTPLPPPTSPDFPAGVFSHKHLDGTLCVYRFNEEGSFAFWWMVSSLDVSHTWPLTSGTYAVDGNLYTEMSDNVADCPPATYAWTYDGQTLAFQLVGEDKCGDRQPTVEKPWTKSE